MRTEAIEMNLMKLLAKFGLTVLGLFSNLLILTAARFEDLEYICIDR